jgi:hypothetical protein
MALPDFSDANKKYDALFEKVLSRRDQILQFKSFLEKETTWLTSRCGASSS